MTETKIFVIYVGVSEIDDTQIKEYCTLIAEKIAPKSIDCELIIIPVLSHDTKIECINPKYITEKELIEEHTRMIQNLQIELNNQLEKLKENNNE
jgi:hypothetical protein